MKSIEVTVNFPDGERTVKMVSSDDIQKTKTGTLVVLFLKDNQQYTGIFQRCDDGMIILSPVAGGRKIALESGWVESFLVAV